MNELYRRLFDEGVERRGMECVKWDDAPRIFGADVLPMWVADMDFAAPQCVQDALIARAAHGAFGYSGRSTRHMQALQGWMQARHGLSVAPEDVLVSPGVVDSMDWAVRALTEPDDLVMIQPPVYGPFFGVVRRNGRRLRLNPLIETPEGYRMDYADMEKGFREGVKLFMLCNPHNPGGRVWTREELLPLVELANRYRVQLISDEIHGDFVMPGCVQTPLLTLPGTENAMMFSAPTKTFNLASLRHSSIFCRNHELLEKIAKVGYTEPNLMGQLAQTAAYEGGAEWIDALNEYIAEARAIVVDFFAEHLPQLRVMPGEGTYLLWVDMRALGMSEPELMRFLAEKAGVGFSKGSDFGEAGTGFVRVNIAAPHKTIRRALEQLRRAIDAR